MPKEMLDFDDSIENRRTVLQTYYARYLTEIRGSSPSTVKHYLDALNNISRRLRAKKIVNTDVYEIMDLNALAEARRILYHDPDFIEQDARGRRMYSSGLNNYYRFASGEGFTDKNSEGTNDNMKLMDIPISPESPRTVSRIEWPRSNILREQALSFANYTCEIDQNHKSFIAENNQRAYMEGHHAIPINHQPKFTHSLDVYANIICLCPTCHRRIHFGLKEDRIHMMYVLYESRAERLSNSGIKLSKDEFAGYVQ